MAKLVYKNKEYGQEVSIKIDNDADINDIGSALYYLLVAVGYAPESIAKILDVEETWENTNG